MRKKFLFLCLIFCLFFQTGCWDKVEIDDRNYIITMGIDSYIPGDESKSASGNQSMPNFTVSLSAAKLQKSNGNDGGKEEGSGSIKRLSSATLVGAMKLSDMAGSRQTYYGQTKAVIFGEELLQNKKLFLEALDSLERDQEINMKIIVLASKGKASDCLETLSKQDDSSGLFLWDFYKNNQKEAAYTKKLDLEGLLISLRENSNALLPMVQVENDEIVLGGAVLLKDYTKIAALEDEQERGSLWMEGQGNGAIVEAPYGENQIPMRVIKNTSNMSFQGKNENIICNVNIHLTGNLEGYTISEQGLFQSDTIQAIEKIFETKVKMEAKQTLEFLQKQHTDALDIVGKMKKSNHSLYQSHRGDPNSVFSQMEFHVNVKVDISGIGVIK